MAIIKAKPITPGRRHSTFYDFSEITKSTPEKGLVYIKKKNSGRNFQGKITVRHQGGGVKRYVRVIDFKRNKFGVPAVINSIEYDPNRGSRIALAFYADGEKKYIIAPLGMKVGDTILSAKELIEIKTGNAMPVSFIPAGVAIHNIELTPEKGGIFARGAGNAAYVMGVEGKYAQIKMPSGEIRLVRKECLCTVGQVGNPDKMHISIGSAGRNRRLGVRPTVRGTAMNPNDHPHGGGEGKQPIGLRHPKTKWGKPAFGVKTRSKKLSSKLIIKRRPKK